MAVLHSLRCYGDVPPPLVTGHCALAVRRQSVDPLRRVAALFNAAMSVGVSVAVSPESVGLGTAGLLGRGAGQMDVSVLCVLADVKLCAIDIAFHFTSRLSNALTLPCSVSASSRRGQIWHQATQTPDL
jgi:hypothetical protein